MKARRIYAETVGNNGQKLAQTAILLYLQVAKMEMYNNERVKTEKRALRFLQIHIGIYSVHSHSPLSPVGILRRRIKGNSWAEDDTELIDTRREKRSV